MAYRIGSRFVSNKAYYNFIKWWGIVTFLHPELEIYTKDVHTVHECELEKKRKLEYRMEEEKRDMNPHYSRLGYIDPTEYDALPRVSDMGLLAEWN